MTEQLPQFEEVHVVSDLHLGGETGFQIFGAGEELKRYIGFLSQHLPDKQIALVINGDFIDFLAEKPSAYFDPKGAVGKLVRIRGDKAFEMVFTALQDFVSKNNRTLVINLGNHDLELALPWVREKLLEILAGGKAEHLGRIRWVMDGTGFLCQVAGAKVLCIHGNEVDDWNVVDFEKLRRIGRDFQRGEYVDAWTPNTGTKLVIEVMNDIKEKLPFVDLLKPEKGAVLPILAALDPQRSEHILGFGKVLPRLAWDKLKRRLDWLEAEEGPPPNKPLPPAWGQTEASMEASEKLLDVTEQRFQEGREPLDLIEDEEAGQLLRVDGAGWKAVTGESTEKVLAEFLEYLDKDPSFNIGEIEKDEDFVKLDAWVSQQIDFLVAGHTHLERAHLRKEGGYYFNSGTWAWLIHLCPDLRKNEEKFKAILEAFRKNLESSSENSSNLSIEQLVKLGFANKHLTVVRIWSVGGRAKGELRHVKSDSIADPPTLEGLSERVADSLYPRD
jgi:UDP-2,3-diacylglucosamine pyrophosphatase LpxH